LLSLLSSRLKSPIKFWSKLLSLFTTNKIFFEFELKNKWYGALSRRGFSLDIVKKVFDIKDIEKANLILEDNL